jgi:hypothetical protein
MQNGPRQIPGGIAGALDSLMAPPAESQRRDLLARSFPARARRIVFPSEAGAVTTVW